MTYSLPKRAIAEMIGTAFLLAAVVGSGIMGEQLAGNNVALVLLINSFATGSALIALILALGPISGAHFNPAVTLALATQKLFSWREAPAYIFAQTLGAFLGVFAAHLMFAKPIITISTHLREGNAQFLSEGIATFGLVMIILGSLRRSPTAVAIAVGTYIASAYWFTASTSFANPAVTLARSVTDTFTGIHPDNIFAFVLAQLLGAGLAALFFCWINRFSRTPD